MLKKTLTYEDLDGNQITEDFYFNINKAEIAEWELSMEGGFSGYLEKIVESMDAGEIINALKEIVRKSIGRRSEDGKRFIKNDEVAEEFFQTNAWPTLFMDLMANEGRGGAEFVEGVMPQDMIEEVKKKQGGSLRPVEDVEPDWLREGRAPTQEELKGATPDQIAKAFAMKQGKA